MADRHIAETILTVPFGLTGSGMALVRLSHTPSI